MEGPNGGLINLNKKAEPTDTVSSLEWRCVNYVRVLAADMVQQANSGHPGAAMGCAPIAHVLWSKVMQYDPAAPHWANRDRFVLSNGHACALQYSMLHLTGYELSLEDLKKFRQIDSKTPGHPEVGITPGVEVATGPLGQGLTNGVGLALATTHMAATFNRDDFKVIDSFVYVICGDGCMQEGITSEACSLAGHLGLGRLIVFYDDNKIQIDGSTDLATEDGQALRGVAGSAFTSRTPYRPRRVDRGDRVGERELNRPTLIKCTTTIGYGSSKQGTAGVHGAPLGHADLAAVKKMYGFDEDGMFTVPADVQAAYLKCRRRVAGHAGGRPVRGLSQGPPGPCQGVERRMSGACPRGGKASRWTPADKALATRQTRRWCSTSSRTILTSSAARPLTPSTAKFRGALDFQLATPEGRYVRFGVREHAAAAICNGMAFCKGLIPFCATFLNFFGYAAGAVRVSALSEHGVLYIATHDSIGLGEDGPTHQPVEALIHFRAMPNVLTLRPADANEVSGAYMVAVEHRKTPSIIALSRQGCPNLAASSPESVRLGAYVVHSHGCGEDGKGTPQLILAGTGSEVSLCISACEKLADLKIKVVSFPCWELFEQQSTSQSTPFSFGIPILAVRPLCGGAKVRALCVGMNAGASAPERTWPTASASPPTTSQTGRLLAFKGKPFRTYWSPHCVAVPHSGHSEYAA